MKWGQEEGSDRRKHSRNLLQGTCILACCAFSVKRSARMRIYVYMTVQCKTRLACETCTIDILNTVVGYQESLLPSHENNSTISFVQSHIRFMSFMPYVLESWEPRPVNKILMLRSSPVLCKEPIPVANDFRIEVCCQFRPIISQAPYPQITAKCRSSEVNILSVGENECSADHSQKGGRYTPQ